jgi:hypothetical protein
VVSVIISVFVNLFTALNFLSVEAANIIDDDDDDDDDDDEYDGVSM